MAAICAPYFPSEVDGLKYWDRVVTNKNVHDELPQGFPTQLKSPLAWKGSEIEEKQSEWKLDLTTSEIAAIDSALTVFEANHEDLSSISASTFKLPTPFSERLRKAAKHLYEGVGFQIIHGLDPLKYSPREKVIVYAGLSAHICPQRGFVDVFRKSVLAHVVNVQAGKVNPETTAPAFSNIPLSFHTDNCEVLAMFFWNMTSSGGQTILSSSWQTYNELASERPDVVHTLAEPWVMDSFKSYELQAPRHVRLLETVDSEKVPLLFRFSRYPVTGWQRKRNPDLPVPTQAQLEALDAVQFIATKNAIKLPVSQGDMLFVNDMALFHAREGFDDGGVPLKRHVAKMYLRDPSQCWDIPSSLEDKWTNRYGGNQPDGSRQELWHISPKPGVEESSSDNG